MIAALYVEANGVYSNLPDVDCWDISRDARLYSGPYSVVAHPPCERWGRYWSGGPSARVRRKLGDDDGCFAAALTAVRRWGGVLEHPEASKAWDNFGINKPPKSGGWIPAHVPLAMLPNAWTCCVEQGHYGHRARKATWLYYVGHTKPPELIWGPSQGERLDEGFHSPEERAAARARGQKPRQRLSKAENLATPIPFRDLLLSLARQSTNQAHCDGTYIDFQGALRRCLSGAEGCGLVGCSAAHGPMGGW